MPLPVRAVVCASGGYVEVANALHACDERTCLAACQNSSVEFWAVRDVAEPSSKPGQMLLPVPYKLPPSPYGPEDVPWMVDGNFPGMDNHGRTVHQEYPPLYGHVEAD